MEPQNSSTGGDAAFPRQHQTGHAKQARIPIIRFGQSLDPQVDWLRFGEGFAMPAAFGAGALLPYRAYPGGLTVKEVAWGPKIKAKEHRFSAYLDFTGVSARKSNPNSKRRSFRRESVWGARQTTLLLTLWNLCANWRTLSFGDPAPGWALIWRAINQGVPCTGGYGGQWRRQVEMDLETMSDTILTFTDHLTGKEESAPLLKATYAEKTAVVCGEERECRVIDGLEWHPYLFRCMHRRNMPGSTAEVFSLDRKTFYSLNGLARTCYLWAPRQAIAREKDGSEFPVSYGSAKTLADLGFYTDEIEFPEQRRVLCERIIKDLHGAVVGSQRGTLDVSLDYSLRPKSEGDGYDYKLLIAFIGSKNANKGIPIHSRVGRLALDAGMAADDIRAILSNRRELHEGETKYIERIRTDWADWSRYYEAARVLIDGLAGEGEFAGIVADVAEAITSDQSTITHPGRILTHRLNSEIVRLASRKSGKRRQT